MFEIVSLYVLLFLKKREQGWSNWLEWTFVFPDTCTQMHLFSFNVSSLCYTANVTVGRNEYQRALFAHFFFLSSEGYYTEKVERKT